nr:hypothetical protein [Tanacetum cinerariifolium]
MPSAATIASGMFKLDLEPLAPKLVHNKEIHINYLKHTQEQADILQGVTFYVQDTCPSAIKLSETNVVLASLFSEAGVIHVNWISYGRCITSR